MSIETDICLYNLTLRYSNSSVRSCAGNFSGRKAQEIITATSNSLTVFRPDSSTGKLSPVLRRQIFGVIRSISNFKVAGSGKDYLVVTSDAGNLSVLELDLENKRFISLFNEPYHKTGMRRLSPGNEIAVDPKGRAVCLSAIERNKLVYVMNRDLDNKLTIASPLEANRSKILTVNTVGVDVGYENPQFAAIEIDYGEYEFQNEDATEFERSLTFYELDLGLNHVVRKHTEKTLSTSNYLLQVPGGSDGPGGVIVCAKNTLCYRNLYGDRISVSIPRPEGDDQDLFIVSGVTHKMKNQFFFLLQTNLGDIVKLELPPDRTLVVSYFDTIPVCTSLIILKSGFLYADTEYGDKYFYQFEKLGRDVKFVSEDDTASEIFHFARSDLENISAVDMLESINPLIDSILQTDETSTKIYALSGTKKHSALKLLQYQLPITEIVESDLPGLANRSWTTKLTEADTFDQYLVISFIDTTLVLSIGESVEEVSDSGLASNEETLGIQQIGRESLAQIHSNGIRVIKDHGLVNEWLPPAGIKILVCSSTNRQIVVGLSNNELVYFEVDDGDKLVEWNERKEMPSRITALSLGEIPEGLIRSPFIIVGDQDKILRVLSADPDSMLEMVIMQSLSGVPTSVLLCFMHGELCVNVGLDNGVFARTFLDSTGQLYQTRTKYLGNKPVILSKTRQKGQNVVLAFSNKTWAISEFKTLKISPIGTPPLRFGFSFNSEDCTDGTVGVYKNKLVIFTIDDFEHDISSNSLELKTTPKKLIKHEQSLFIFETGEGSYIHKFDIDSNDMTGEIDLIPNEKILSATVVRFESKKQSYIAVSVISNEGSFIHIYTLNLDFVHKTKLSDAAHAITPFQGQLLVATKNRLRLFEIGIKQLLSKATTLLDTVENIVKIDVKGSRVAIGDIRESVTFLTYNSKLNEFVPFVDDVISRHMTSMKMIDYNTVVGGDKFGNLFLLRCSNEISKIGENSSLVLTKDKLYNGAPYKLDNICNFFIEDVPTSFNKGAFTQGGRDVLAYTGIQGTVGVLIPLLTRSDIKFFQSLERAMRLHVANLIGRMHLKYRGYYQPVKNVIDGDFIETFNDLDEEIKAKVADEVEKDVSEVSAKIYDIRALSI